MLKNYFKNNKLFLILGLVFLLPTLISFYTCKKEFNRNINASYEEALNKYDWSYDNDIYNKEIAEIDDFESLVKLVDKRIIDKNDYNLAKEIQFIVRESFVHGISYLYPCENWALYLLSKFPLKRLNDKKLNAVISPERMLKSPFAFCSQNALVLQRLLKHYNIEFASIHVGIKSRSHYASAAKINGEWYYLDSNLEYKLINNELYKLGDYFDTNNIEIIKNLYGFDEALAEAVLKGRQSGETYLFSINKFPASKGLFIQNTTRIISRWGWLFFIIIYQIRLILKKVV